MIEIKNLNKSFKDKVVLEDLNLQIEDGKVLGLVGINGAGKSTLLRLISNIFEPDSGVILIDGENVHDNDKIKNQIFFLPDEPYYTSNTTPLNIIDFYDRFYDFDKDEYINRLRKFNLPLDKHIKTFSKGMKRQVFVCLGLSIKPKYLLLDEAFDGLDPLARLSLKKDLIKLISENGTTVIISSHSLRELEDICDCYALIDNKRVSSSGAIEDNIAKYHKYQIAFARDINKEDIDFPCESINIDNHFVKIITKLDYEEFSKAISKLEPLIIDEIPIDFEELFVIEVENRGYLKND